MLKSSKCSWHLGAFFNFYLTFCEKMANFAVKCGGV